MSLDKDCCLETYSEAYRQGKADEQDRIIKLLINEGLLKPSENYDQAIIEQIKGEQE